MTANSLKYQEIQENIRHNQVNERLDHMRNSENKRHNMIMENETARHNEQSEKDTRRGQDISRLNTLDDVEEKTRHNTAIEYIDSLQLAENVRHNQSSEVISTKQAEAAYVSAGAAASQARTRAGELQLARDNAEGNTQRGAADINYVDAKTLNEGTEAIIRGETGMDLVESQIWANKSGFLGKVIGSVAALIGTL